MCLVGPLVYCYTLISASGKLFQCKVCIGPRALDSPLPNMVLTLAAIEQWLIPSRKHVYTASVLATPDPLSAFCILWAYVCISGCQ